MLRHTCGFKLANDGVDTRSLQAYLGHSSIQHTMRYTELAPGRFKSFGHLDVILLDKLELEQGVNALGRQTALLHAFLPLARDHATH